MKLVVCGSVVLQRLGELTYSTEKLAWEAAEPLDYLQVSSIDFVELTGEFKRTRE